MEDNNMNKKQQLYRALGDVRDCYVAGAASFLTANRIRRKRRNVILTAAAAVVVLCIIAVSMVAGMTTTESSAPGGYQTGIEVNTGGYSDKRIDPEVSVSYSVSILNQSECSAFEVSDVDYYDGAVKIIWTYSGSDTLYCVETDSATADELFALQADASHKSDVDGVINFRMWVCYSDGTVLTPFLDRGGENGRQGAIFNYESGYDITDGALKLLNNLVN